MTDVSHPAPEFSLVEAQTLAETHFGLTGELSALDSERDQNFRLSQADGRQMILKIVNASEPGSESAFQTALLAHLENHAPEMAAPRLRKTRGSEALAFAVSNGQTHAVRLVEWLPGVPLAEVKRTPAQLANLGMALGQLGRALQGFIHPGALRSFDWDIRNAGAARQRLGAIDNLDDRTLLGRLLDHFENSVAPRLSRLRAQIIHNDANDWNVLVNAGDHDQIAGIIDFGDALHAPLIADVAVACAYAILDLEDPVSAAAQLVAGYHAAYPLQPEEIDLLFDLIAMRLVISVTLSAERKALVGDNPYLAISEAPAWRLLRRMDGINRNFATAILRHACGHEAVTGARGVVGWINENRTSFASILDRHPATLTKALVPYADPEHPMTLQSAGQEPEKATAWWDAYCAQTGVALGLGPWGEERTVYTSDIFRSRFVEGVRRIHHLGLDLFMPAGTPLYTPLDAVVKSVEVEHDPLGYGCIVTLEHEPENCPAFVTLWGHMAHEAASRLTPGATLKAGTLVGYMGEPAENGGWAPHLHFQISTDTRLAARDILGVGEARYLDVWSELFPDASTLAGIPPEAFEKTGRPRTEIEATRRDILLPNLSISYSEPIKFVRGDGPWLIDDRGRAYLDCFNNVCHLGHAHPDVVRAIATQAARLNTNTRYLHDGIVNYAERLTATLPEGLAVASFACTGSEANSLMMRMARAHTGRNEAIVLDWAYHGTTQELIDISPYKYKRKGGKGRPDHVFEATIPDSYRAPLEWPIEEYASRFAQSVAEQIATMSAQGRAPGLFIAESIPSVAGQVFLPNGYLEEVYAMVRAAGGICVADEVQVGFGRVGTHWWAFESQNVVPDIVTMGKPIGNGHPMAALVTTREIARSFDNGMEYFNTFAGNPVSCAAGLAVLDVIERDGLRENARIIGDYLLRSFNALKQRFDIIGDVRGQGLFLGVELVTDRTTKVPATEIARRVNDGMRERGVLIGTEGPYDNVLKMRPPMIFTKANADHLIGTLEETLNAVMARG
ncbi:aminotransferase class III-fold pyridoxal phosphate-dependent enzyme [Mesorhizobium sp. NBSH29]|uniref:aminotransferase class III-fold pyridoxal phosphate-dependent enzyme n=1 Tax=Mesorhizobium sp. NBSH29 TaxID=2654249 RepID=UPI00189647E5|nr:aminotransferase class III-fold pyridoxal phosphate-dependent enzyme [Mesorhizobium sp. NBSH29]QPC87602.1 aminotransferase class III-fold pyridoxal phosphate-dependent enzyme [Mesorhizobium sp. NBSH29]